MKRKWKFLLFCILVCTCILSGCGGKLDLGGSKWEMDELVTADGQRFGQDMLENSIGEMQITFVDDSTFFVSGGQNALQGTYSADGQKLTMITDQGTVQEAEVKGSKLVLYSTNDSVELIMKRK